MKKGHAGVEKRAEAATATAGVVDQQAPVPSGPAEGDVSIDPGAPETPVDQEALGPVEEDVALTEPAAEPMPPPSPEREALARKQAQLAALQAELAVTRHERDGRAAAVAAAEASSKSLRVAALLDPTPEAQAAALENARTLKDGLEAETGARAKMDDLSTAIALVTTEIDRLALSIKFDERRRVLKLLEEARADDQRELIAIHARWWLWSDLQGAPPGRADRMILGNTKLALALAGPGVQERAVRLRRQLLHESWRREVSK